MGILGNKKVDKLAKQAAKKGNIKSELRELKLFLFPFN